MIVSLFTDKQRGGPLIPLLERDVHLFDLDNTLYHPSNAILEQIAPRMRRFISNELSISIEESNALCDNYYQRYGGTIRGIQLHHSSVNLNQFSEFSLAHFFGVLFSAAVVSRFSALCLIQYSEYARDDETSKSTQSSHQLPLPYLLGALLFSLLSLLWMPVISILVIVIVTTISTLLCKSYFHNKIEGYTGDCLGFLQQLNELLILLTCLALFSAN